MESALYLTDLGDMDAVFREYDSNLSKNVITENLFGLLDASSLLWRLEVTGVDVGEERWNKVHKAISEHAHNHRSPWLVGVAVWGCMAFFFWGGGESLLLVVWSIYDANV